MRPGERVVRISNRDPDSAGWRINSSHKSATRSSSVRSFGNSVSFIDADEEADSFVYPDSHKDSDANPHENAYSNPNEDKDAKSDEDTDADTDTYAYPNTIS